MSSDGNRGRRPPRQPMDTNRRPPAGSRAAGPTNASGPFTAAKPSTAAGRSTAAGPSTAAGRSTAAGPSAAAGRSTAAGPAAVSSPGAARHRPVSGPTGARKNSGAKWCSNAERCPLCCKSRKSFHCKTCVADGNFVHSSVAAAPTPAAVTKASDFRSKFSKKKAKLQTVAYSASLFKNDCAKMIARKQHSTSKKAETLILQDKIQNIRLAIADKNKTITDKKNQLQKLKLEIDGQKSRNDRYQKRVNRLEEFTRSQEVILDDKTNQLNAIRPDLKSVIQKRVNQLVTHIFPLDEVHPVIYPDEELDDTNNLSRALSEASKLTYVCGQWVNTCEEWSRQTEFGYRIVASTLPANGNYSAYNEWVADKSKDYAFNQTFSEPNPACKISAGLTYTSQLVKQLSFFLNVFLPRRPNFSEFCGNELTPNKFAKYVTHLNANVLYLCISQNVDPKYLNPDHTLKNILLLLDMTYSDLGRFSPPDIDSSLCNIFEEKITLQLLSCTGDSDSEEENYHEWEDVPSIEFSQEESEFSLDTTSSVVRAGLVASTAASIASMWRGWTK